MNNEPITVTQDQQHQRQSNRDTSKIETQEKHSICVIYLVEHSMKDQPTITGNNKEIWQSDRSGNEKRQ